MTKKLVIAEKPEVARAIGTAFYGTHEKAKLPIVGDDFVITSCAGHIIELVEPEDVDPKWAKPWNIEALPIYIEDWPKQICEGKENYADIIKEWLTKVESVVHAGDMDDEGQIIVDEVLDYFGYQGKVERVLINNNLAKNIIKAFDDLRDNKDFEHKGKVALARSIADFSFGATESRFATLNLGKGVSVGRVQTPTLGLIVTRDLEIANHIKEKYFEMMASVQNEAFGELALKMKPHKAFLGDLSRINDPQVLEAEKSAVEASSQTLTTKESISTKKPPLPYHFDALCIEMSKAHGLSSKETLDITQVLRQQHGAITYNRTASSYLSEEHFAQAEVVLGSALKNIGCDTELDFSIKSKAFDDAALEGDGHHGIIPEDTTFDFAALDEKSQKVYEAITLRYAAQFMEPARYEVSKSSFETEAGTYSREVRRLVFPGWLSLFPENEKEDTQTWVSEGELEVTVARCEIEEKESAPKKPYTEGTLIADMTSIAKYVKDERLREALLKKDEESKNEKGSIGTQATRHAIIDLLIARGYIERKGKQIRSTQLGRDFYNVLPQMIKGADLTALWFLMQQKIAAGEADVNIIQRSVVDTFNAHKDTSYAGKSLHKVFGTCPNCKEKVIDKKASYECSSNRYKKEDGGWVQASGCGFRLFKKVFGKSLNEAHAKELLTKGATSKKVAGFKKKNGSGTYSARLSMCKKTGKINLIFQK